MNQIVVHSYNNQNFAPPAPIVFVTLRNLEATRFVERVLLLIDTGADVSLIPLSWINILQISAVAEQSYELTSFNGATSQATSVKLELVVLQKSFRGQFLVLDQEFGILGRNILNRLRLTFDGPQQHWYEVR